MNVISVFIRVQVFSQCLRNGIASPVNVLFKQFRFCQLLFQLVSFILVSFLKIEKRHFNSGTHKTMPAALREKKQKAKEKKKNRTLINFFLPCRHDVKEGPIKRFRLLPIDPINLKEDS